MDQRKSALSAWARRCLEELAGLRPESELARALAQAPVETVSGDASFRRYFRIRLNGSLLRGGGVVVVFTCTVLNSVYRAATATRCRQTRFVSFWLKRQNYYNS